MSFADCVKDTSTSTGTGAFVLSGTPPIGCQALSAIGPTGTTFGYKIENGAEWETGIGTITAANTFSRAPSASSNAGALINFSAGTKTVFHDVTAAQFAKFQSVNAAAFAAAVPLTAIGAIYMPQQTVVGATTLTIVAGAVAGAFCNIRYVADGNPAHTVTVGSGALEEIGSAGYDNRAGIINSLWLWSDGYDKWFKWSQAVGAVAVDTVTPTASSAVVANATPTFVDITFSEPMDQGFVPPVSTVVAATHTTSSLTWQSTTVLRATQTSAFVNGESRSLVITPNGTNNLRDLAGNQITTTQTITTITNNVAAPASAVTLARSAASGVVGAGVTITVSTNNPLTGSQTESVALSSDVAGTWSVNPVALSAGTAAATSVFTPSATGSATITGTATGTPTLSNGTIGYTSNAAATVPAAPTIGTAVAGDGYVDVAFTHNSDGGASVIDSTATLSTGETATGTTSPIRVTAANGTARTATVKDRNSVGLSAASAASNSVTPAAAGGTDTLVTLTNLANGLAMGTTGEYSGGGAAYTAATAGHGQAGTLKIPSGQAGRVSFDWTTANNCLLILDETVGTVDHNNALFALWMYVPATLVQYSTNAGSGSGSVNYKTPAAGLRYSINKTAGGTLTVEESVDSGANWSVIYTFGTAWATGDLYPAWVGAVVHQPRSSGLV